MNKKTYLYFALHIIWMSNKYFVLCLKTNNLLTVKLLSAKNEITHTWALTYQVCISLQTTIIVG